MIGRRRSFASIVVVACFLAIVFLITQLLDSSRYYSPTIQTYYPIPFPYLQDYDVNNTKSTVTEQLDSQDACAWMPDTSNILVIMKTGASESFDKVPTQLMTTLKCLPEFLIFSDMEQKIAAVDIYDSLDTVRPEAKDNNPDFDLYRQQQMCAVDQENCKKDAKSSGAGWTLDKYKNVHMAEKTFRMRPNYDWYIFIDADTYVLWPNLVQWLKKLDSSRGLYLGSLSSVALFPFGHGGSGYVLSQKTMSEFAGKHPGIAHVYDMKVQQVCCGDWMLSVALNQTTGIQLQNAWPNINGQKPHTIPYGPLEWCHPLMTMHQVNSEEVSSFWEFEKRFYSPDSLSTRPRRRPLLIKDVYHEFFEPKLIDKREDWDNLSEDVYYLDPDAKEYEDWQLKRRKTEDMYDLERVAHRSFEDCRTMCKWLGECFQFRFQDGICASSRTFTLGVPRKREDEEGKRWMSGWAVEKIRLWIEMQGNCDEPVWPDVW